MFRTESVGLCTPIDSADGSRFCAAMPLQTEVVHVQEGNRPNTLGLRDKEREDLLNSIEAASPGSGSNADRVHSRWQFAGGSLKVKIHQIGGTESEALMICRNLSKGGVGLLHRSYVHLGTECTVTIPHPSKGDQDYKGKVVRCLHVKGMVHEIGIAFEREIPLREIAKPDPMQELYAIENLKPEELVGVILLVEDSDMDVKLVKHFLRETQVRVKHASTVTEAEELIKTGVGLVLCDIHLGEENGGDFARKADEVMHRCPPIVMVSADRAQSTYDLISKPFVKGFLAKPFTQGSLLRTVAEFMVDPVAQETTGESSGIEVDSQIAAVLLPELTKACGKLKDAVEASDPKKTLSVLMQLAGVAPVLGLDDLAVLTETLSQQLGTSQDVSRVAGRIDEITRLCEKAANR